MKKNLKIFIILFIVFITCFNIGFPILSYSADIDLDKDFEQANKTWQDVGGDLLDGVVGLLTWPPRAIIEYHTHAIMWSWFIRFDINSRRYYIYRCI